MMQRGLDVLLAGIALACLSPLLISLSLALRFTGEGEVFYRQERVGRNGRIFGLMKFATMLKDSPRIGTGEITVRNDPRILPIGRFLRKSKLNELPQLWNILVGDMSIVGPRPMVPKTFERYPAHSKERICSVRPGLSGIGSILFRDEERYLDGHRDPVAFYNAIIIPYKAELELWYVTHRSLGLYLKVIFATGWVIFFPDSKLPQALFSGLPQPPKELVAA